MAAAPNIALGDALGSCIFNLAMLVVLDVMSRNEPVYRYIDQGHILTAGRIFVVALLFRPETRFRGTIGWVSLGCVR